MRPDPVAETLIAYFVYRCAAYERDAVATAEAYQPFHELWRTLDEDGTAEFNARLTAYYLLKVRFCPPPDDDREAIQEGDYRYYRTPNEGGTG